LAHIAAPFAARLAGDGTKGNERVNRYRRARHVAIFVSAGSQIGR
jgi:hypothetical protein